jgi:hypothetical protein
MRMSTGLGEEIAWRNSCRGFGGECTVIGVGTLEQGHDAGFSSKALGSLRLVCLRNPGLACNRGLR